MSSFSSVEVGAASEVKTVASAWAKPEKNKHEHKHICRKKNDKRRNMDDVGDYGLSF